MIFYTYTATSAKRPYDRRDTPLSISAKPTWLGRFFGLKSKQATIYLKPWIGWFFDNTDTPADFFVEMTAIRWVDQNGRMSSNNSLSPWKILGE